jgi:Uma2 family endonuclease
MDTKAVAQRSAEDAMAVQMQHWRFSVEDYHRMAEIGIFGEDGGEDARVELIEGEIVVMSPIGGKHAHTTNQFNRRLVRQVGDDFVVSVQNPIRLTDYSEPQPDLAVIRDRDYRGETPPAADVLLVIEVSDTTLSNDRNVKVPLYAAAGIPEAWIADLKGGRIVRFSEPREGRYQVVAHARRGETMASLVLPTISIAVDDVIQ